MKVIAGVNRIINFKKPVVALGVFDGVHAGHRKILEAAVRKSRQIKGTSIVITFWPHPQGKENLYSLEHRLKLINEIGIDACIVVHFTKAFARIRAIEFVKDILVKKLKAHYIYIGKNFRFGRNAEGDCKLLRNASCIYNFKLRVFDVITTHTKPISSTYIRSLIKKGKLNAARRLLGRRVNILGTVIRGSMVGKSIGFPTANINPHHEVIPADGVYSVGIMLGVKKLKGLCYIGTRPTFKTQKLKRIEVHILNFYRNIYGKNLEIQFIKKIRNEKKFSTPSDLGKQIKKDIAISQRIFSLH